MSSRSQVQTMSTACLARQSLLICYNIIHRCIVTVNSPISPQSIISSPQKLRFFCDTAMTFAQPCHWFSCQPVGCCILLSLRPAERFESHPPTHPPTHLFVCFFLTPLGRSTEVLWVPLRVVWGGCASGILSVSPEHFSDLLPLALRCKHTHSTFTLITHTHRLLRKAVNIT